MNTTTEAQDRLGLPAEAWLPCTAVQPSDAEKMILDGDWPTAEAFLAEQSPLEILRIYLALLPAVCERYDALGIPQEIFRDGLRDITLWSQEHRKRCGTLGLDAWPWVAKTLRLEVFHLGRLQFEPAHAEAALQCSFARFPEGTPLLNIHIPAGAPLRENEVLESLRKAQPFFRRYLDFDTPSCCTAIHGCCLRRCGSCFRRDPGLCGFSRCLRSMQRRRAVRQRSVFSAASRTTRRIIRRPPCSSAG